MAVTRRDALKTSGLALGALALGGGNAGAQCLPHTNCIFSDAQKAQQYSYLPTETIDLYKTPLQDNEMRITFLGSVMPPARLAQAEMSVFVEVGPWTQPKDSNDPAKGKATESFIFDCGAGSATNFSALGIAFRKMDKVFINHLHADHMNDLAHIYCFGAAGDRHSPMYVWGPSASGIRSPRFPYRLYDDGTRNFCKTLREAMRWHSESFSFLPTAHASYQIPTKELWGTPCDLIPVGDDPRYDGYAMIPIELDWKERGGVAYDNQETGVRITHFPVIHARKGAIGYKLEWNGLSMIYTSDTKPERLSVEQAHNHRKGVDVFIHEMILPPEAWALKLAGLTEPPPQGTPEWLAFEKGVQKMKTIQDSSHTPQGAFGYLLSEIHPRPRLTVACHFPVADDTVECALKSVQAHCPDITAIGDKLTWAFDRLVVSVFAGDPKPPIVQRVVAPVSNFSFSPPAVTYLDDLPPKYRDENGNSDPYAQLDLSTWIRWKEGHRVNYCPDGY